ncbi:MAG: riboflavin synthase [Methylococcales bacterium]|jgi:riboflavin synthase|nr:riboflavin synthase [Methylococcales bacterium]MBT7444625.1 riboflavin synthase [Methylococcales bacterium]
MFTGIIQAIGRITAMEQRGGDFRIRLNTGKLPLADVQLGDSIAVNGVCLTAVALPGDGFEADVSGETIACTSLGQLAVGCDVNLEKALTLSTPLGGHLVSGHVDGLGEVKKRYDEGRSVRFDIEAPKAIAHYIAEKGSITVNGVSLTVNQISGRVFTLNIVPHTLQETTLQSMKVGSKINLEVDVIARYLERLITGKQEQDNEVSGITMAFLNKHGIG